MHYIIPLKNPSFSTKFLSHSFSIPLIYVSDSPLPPYFLSTMPLRAVRPRVIDYMGIVFGEGIEGEAQRTKYAKLFNCEVTPTRYVDEPVLHNLGLIGSVNWMLRNLGMSHLCTLPSRTYVRLNYEFLSSFSYQMLVGYQRTICTVKFRMFNRNYEFIQDHLDGLL